MMERVLASPAEQADDRMSQSRWLRDLPVLVTLAFLYFVASKLGLRLAFVHASASPVWPPAGIALSALLILGPRVWPAVFVGAFAANLMTAGSVATSIGIGAGNTLEAVVGAYLVRRFANGRQAFERGRDVFAFAVLASLLSTTVSATFGVTSLSLGGFAHWADYGSIWLTWWLGDAVGDIIATPLVLLWSAHLRVRWSRGQIAEGAVLVLGLLLVSLFVFGGLYPSVNRDFPLEFLCVPLLIWAAFRFGVRESATVIALMSGVAIWGTLRGFGPFAKASPNESLLLLQAFMGVTAVTILALAAVVAERNRIEGRLRQLAVTDPLTGLANYRHLIHVLENEIRRSQRTQRAFAALLLDVDRLKTINDRHGHLVGSRALCRVADILRRSCRVTDTAARYGGDEFVMVLPETEEPAARQVADRIAQRVRSDPERPPVSVSFGVAVYPRDGETAETLLSTADRALYAMKAGGGPPVPPGGPQR